MKTIIVRIKTPTKKSYPILIGTGLVGRLGELFNLSEYSRIAVVTDKTVNKVMLRTMPEFLPDKTFVIVLPEGERMKHIGCVIEVWSELARMECDKKTLIINIGGGVIGDLGGFAASTYMRGIDFINIPTTLLAQVDASVGGKTGINFEEIKNLIGTYNQPKAVVIDIDALKTLPQREFIAGFAEIIKHGLIFDKEYFSLVTAKKPGEFTNQELMEIIRISCKIKATVVVEDEKEINFRKILNFGHTVGHALEILSHNTKSPLLHGEAIAIGMTIESFIAFKCGLLKQEELAQIHQALTYASLPIRYTNMQPKAVLKKMKTDKKNSKGEIRFTLLQTIGKAVVNQHVKTEVIEEALKQFVA